MALTPHRNLGETFAGYTQLTTVTCTCGIAYAIPDVLNDRALGKRGPNGLQIYCPNGHRWHYTGLSMQEKLDRERRATEAARSERETARRAEQAQRAAATRARNERNRARKRSADGVCPCCGRTFKQVARHMANKHPDYDPHA